MKGHCDYHTSEPVEAEIVEYHGRGVRYITDRAGKIVKYVMLRCTECNRTRGIRRKVITP